MTPVTCQEIARNQHGDLVLLAHDVTPRFMRRGSYLRDAAPPVFAQGDQVRARMKGDLDRNQMLFVASTCLEYDQREKPMSCG